MKRIFTCLLLLCAGIQLLSADDDNSLAQLDDVIAHRDIYLYKKNNRIDSIKAGLKTASSTERQLEIYNNLYDEYLTLSFDSAITYIDKAESLVAGINNYNLNAQVKTQRAMLFAIAGHFSQAADILKTINSSRLSDSLKEEYYYAARWTYGFWAEYSHDGTFAPEYTCKSTAYLDSLLTVTPTDTPDYYYRLAERMFIDQDFELAKEYYLKVTDKQPRDTRLYAQASYALAITCNKLNDKKNYRQWLINAAISDQIIPLKEHLALQDLALLLKNEDGDLKRANAYLKISLDDALMYNNRLRIMEIGRKTPDIINAYQEAIEQQNRILKFYICIIFIILLSLIGSIVFIAKQRKKIQHRNKLLSSFNNQLQELNDRLQKTNRSREQYVNLFMDLCISYIEKFNRFQMTVITKTKAGQFDDLLRVANNARPSDTELRELFFNFDTAFLRIYPDFIKKFNTLLQPDKAIVPKNNELLTSDLRIFALIRIGITDSTKIASLLFYSPQTVFNRRTQVRNRAINRDTFEKELMNICSIQPE